MCSLIWEGGLGPEGLWDSVSPGVPHSPSPSLRRHVELRLSHSKGIQTGSRSDLAQREAPWHPCLPACRRGARALSLAQNKSPFPKQSPANAPCVWRLAMWKHDAFGGPSCGYCSHFSDVATCLGHDFSTSVPPNSGKGMSDNGGVYRARVCHKAL